MVTPLIACFDIETTNLDPMWGITLCAEVKPWGESARTFINRETGYNDAVITCALVEELSKYQILIAHNGVFFDRKYINGRALYNHSPLLNPRGKMIDPWRLAKNHLNFKGNSLERLGDFLECDVQKTVVSGETWMIAGYERGLTLRGDASLTYIVEHCQRDVVVLEHVYERLVEFTGIVQPWGSA